MVAPYVSIHVDIDRQQTESKLTCGTYYCYAHTIYLVTYYTNMCMYVVH